MVGPKLDDSGSGTVNLVTWAEAQAARQGGGGSLSEYYTSGVSAAHEPAMPRVGKKSKKDATSLALPASSSATSSSAPLLHGMRPEMVVGASGEGSAVRMRMATAQALGHLIKSVHNHVNMNRG